MIHLENALSALATVMCPLRLPMHLTLPAVFDPLDRQLTRGILHLGHCPRVRPCRPPVGQERQETQGIENYETDCPQSVQWETCEELMFFVFLHVPIENAKIVAAEVAIEHQ
jgi:hypothetical protein